MQGALLRKNGKLGWANRLAAWSYGSYAWIVFALVVLVFGALSILVHQPSLGRRIARCGTYLLFRLIKMPVSVEGIARLPEGPHVIVVNHASFLDGLALTALLPAAPGYAFAVRQEFRSQALLYPLLKSLGTLVLHRLDVNPAVSDVRRMADLLKDGERLVVFPEGGFRPEPGLQSFHLGAFAAAAEAGVPVVAAALHGARQALPPGTWLPRRIPLKLDIGGIQYPYGSSKESVSRMASLAHAAVSAMLGEEASGR